MEKIMDNYSSNLTFMELFINPISNNISEKMIKLGKLFIKYDYPLYPPHWLDDTPLIIIKEGNDFNEWYRSLDRIITFFKDRSRPLGAVTIDKEVITPLDLGSIKGYSLANDLTELRYQEREGLIKLWSPTLYGYEILNSIYSLYLQLGEERYSFLNEVNPDIQVRKGGVYIKVNNYEKIDIGFRDKEVVMERRGKRKVSNPFCYIHPSEYPTSFIVWFSLFTLGISSSKISQTFGIYIDNVLKGIWADDYSYGEKPKEDSVKHAINSNIVKSMELRYGSNVGLDLVYPGMSLKIGSNVSPLGDVSSIKLIQHLIDKGIPCAPHKYAKYDEYVIRGVGAESMGIGLRVNSEGGKDLLSISVDAKSKEGAKMFNRPTGNWKSTTAEGTSKMPLVSSHLVMRTTEGDKKLYGIRMKDVAITNSRLGNGSGVGSIHPNKPISYRLNKVVKGEIPSYLIPPSQADILRKSGGYGDSILHRLIPHILNKISPLVGKSFKPNETILDIWSKYPQYHSHIIKAPDVNIEFTLDDVSEDNIEVIQYSEHKSSLNISLPLSAEVEDLEVKVRVPGGKFTTLPEMITFEDNRDWSLFLPYEALKGRLLLLFVFSNHVYEEYGIESFYLPNEGILTFGKSIRLMGQDVESIDLTSNDNVFEEWVKENTSMVWVEREVSKHILHYLYEDNRDMVQLLGESKPDADIKVISEISNGYKVAEYIQCLMGEIHINIEIVSPREYLNEQGISLEQLAILETISPRLANYINEISLPIHQGVKSFIEFSQGKYIQNKNVPLYTSLELSDYLKEYLRVESIRKEGNLIRKCDKLFPFGLVMTYNESSIFIHFGLIGQYGEISEGGSLVKGLASSICHLIRSLLKDEVNEKEIKIISDLIKVESVQWIQRMKGSTSGSSKVIKRLGKSINTTCLGLKVKTSQLPEVEHEDNLPIYIFHPDCESIKRLRLRDGDFITVGRNPMGSLAFGIAHISSLRGHIGHVKCSPIIWDKSVAGDSDGDVAIIINLSTLPLDIKKEELLIWNESLIMMGNSSYLNDDTFKGYVSPKAKWTSKVLSPIPFSSYKPNNPDPITTIIPSYHYEGMTDKVANHYNYNVGNGYGIYSLLAFWCANQAAILRSNYEYDENDIDQMKIMMSILNSNKVFTNLQKSLTLSCRILYEEKGLGGYSKERSHVFSLLTALNLDNVSVSNANKNNRVLKVYVDNEPFYMPYRNIEMYLDNTFEVIDGKKELSKLLFGRDNEIEVINLILEANSLRLTFSRLERGTVKYLSNPINQWPNTQQRAAIYGALRRLGQGSYKEGVNGISLFQITQDLMINQREVFDNFVKSPTLRYYLTENSPYLYLLHTQFHTQLR